MSTTWSSFVQSPHELFVSRSLRFREDNKDVWLPATRLRDGMDVLEVGCASGPLCQRIKSLLPDCTVTGLDRDEGHIEYATRAAAKRGIGCRFVTGDALRMPFVDDSFDACTSHTVIEHIETSGFLREQLRVLRPGGVVSVLSVRPGGDANAERWRPVDEEESRLFDKAWSVAAASAERYGAAGYRLREPEFPAALERAGFVAVDVDFIALTWYAPDRATVPDDLAIEQINCNRLSALESVRKAQRVAPGALRESERERLIWLINDRFDRRISRYRQGISEWDMVTAQVMITTGRKPAGPR